MNAIPPKQDIIILSLPVASGARQLARDFMSGGCSQSSYMDLYNILSNSMLINSNGYFEIDKNSFVLKQFYVYLYFI